MDKQMPACEVCNEKMIEVIQLDRGTFHVCLFCDQPTCTICGRDKPECNCDSYYWEEDCQDALKDTDRWAYAPWVGTPPGKGEAWRVINPFVK